MITGDRTLAQGKKGGFYYMLEEFSKYWNRIDIICPRISNNPAAAGDQPFQPFSNVFVHSSPWHKIFQPWFILKKGIEIYKKEKFNLFTIHSYPSFYNDIGGCWLYSKIKVPYVLEIMHIAGYPKAGSLKEWLYKVSTKLFIKHNAKKAKAVRIINQKQTLEFLRKAGVDEKKIKYIPAFYIDLDVFKPLNLEKKYDLVFSGRLVKNKGIFLLLEAVKKLRNLKLAIVGSGPLEDKIKKNKNVEFIGWVPEAEDLARVYNQSKIFVMPSFNEGGPRTPLEAMACRVPVVTSKVGVMIDIINPSTSSGQVNGLFIDWNVDDIAKKIKLLLEDKDLPRSHNNAVRGLYKKIAENGYKTVQQFERKRAIKNYALSYQKLL